MPLEPISRGPTLLAPKSLRREAVFTLSQSAELSQIFFDEFEEREDLDMVRISDTEPDMDCFPALGLGLRRQSRPSSGSVSVCGFDQLVWDEDRMDLNSMAMEEDSTLFGAASQAGFLDLDVIQDTCFDHDDDFEGGLENDEDVVDCHAFNVFSTGDDGYGAGVCAPGFVDSEGLWNE